MVKTIFVGNLPSDINEEEIGDLFAKYGVVQSVNMISHSKTGRSRGICFIEMNPDDADAAIQGLNGTEFKGRSIHVRHIENEDIKDTSPLG